MGDAGEGLVDTESRVQERMEELARERREKRRQHVRDPEAHRTLESLKLARAAMASQLAATAHENRRTVLLQALAEIDRRMAVVSPGAV